MNELERHYRAAMRWYTAKWRRSNGDALLSTLVDQAEADGRSEPTEIELRNLAWMGIRQRAFAAVPYGFFAVAFATLLIVAALVIADVSAYDEMIVTMPRMVTLAHPLYYFPSSAPFFSTDAFPARWMYAVGAVVFLGCAVGGIVTLRRNRRIVNA